MCIVLYCLYKKCWHHERELHRQMVKKDGNEAITVYKTLLSLSIQRSTNFFLVDLLFSFYTSLGLSSHLRDYHQLSAAS